MCMWKVFLVYLQCFISWSQAVVLMDAIGSDNQVAISDALKRPDGQKDLNKVGRGGQTPLMHAVLGGKINAVRLLLEAGADVTIGEENGYTPMHGAGFQGQAEIADLLVAHGISVHSTHTDGYTAFHRACWGIEKRHTDTVEAFLNHGVDGTLLSESGKSCLDMTTNKLTKKLVRNWIAADQESKKSKNTVNNNNKKKKKKKKSTSTSKGKGKKEDAKKSDL